MSRRRLAISLSLSSMVSRSAVTFRSASSSAASSSARIASASTSAASALAARAANWSSLIPSNSRSSVDFCSEAEIWATLSLSSELAWRSSESSSASSLTCWLRRDSASSRPDKAWLTKK